MITTHGLSEWLEYKRYSDNKTVSARLVKGEEKGGSNSTLYMEIKEARMGPFNCPHCGEMLTQGDTGAFPNFLMIPNIFHDRHKPVKST